MAENRRRVDVGGYQLAYEVAGTGSPAVVLEAGIGGAADTWDSVFVPLSQITRVCRYDRAGRGRSDPAQTPRSCIAAVTDLHSLLARVPLPSPYVLVGHSFGGLLIRLFTARYPDEVSGLVLLDAAHQDTMARYLACLPAPTADEPRALAAARSFLGGGYAERPFNPEGFDLDTMPRLVEGNGPLGDLPLAVLTAGRYELPPGLPEALAAPLREVRLALQRELAALSMRSTHVLAGQSGHDIQVDQPDLLIDAIRGLVEASRARPFSPV